MIQSVDNIHIGDISRYFWYIDPLLICIYPLKDAFKEYYIEQITLSVTEQEAQLVLNSCYAQED